MTDPHAHAASPRHPVTLRPRDVGELIEASGYPCVSVLLSTTRSDLMTPEDARRLRGLVARVEEMLDEVHLGGARRIRHRLRELADVATWSPTDRGLALLVSQAVAKAVLLPQPVTDRAVLEPTFATRDLVLALHRTPPYLLLALHPTCAHLFEGLGQRLTEVPAGAPPMTLSGSVAEAIGVLRTAEAEEDQISDFLGRVDRWLGEYRLAHPSPLVLAGPAAMLDRFTTMSRNLHRLAGRVGAEEAGTPAQLAGAASLLLERYLYSRREEALRLLTRTERERPEDVVRGTQRCLRFARSGRPRMLVVEEGYTVPGTAQHGQARVHDLVDDLMEVVIRRGGQLALVADGDLWGAGAASHAGTEDADERRVVMVMRS